MILKIILIIIILSVMAIGIYAYKNLNYDRNYEKLIKDSGAIEKQILLPDGSTLNYGEIKNDNTPLLLIHGQQVSWENYRNVLGELAKFYHIYAIDYYGHGGSDKNPDKYTGEIIGDDFIWFIKNVIKEPTVISGHSSGGLIGAWISAKAPGMVLGLVIEDAPFFSTEPKRKEETVSSYVFKGMYDFLHQDKENNYSIYSLKHHFMKKYWSEESWRNQILDPCIKQIKSGKRKIPRLWYMPAALNKIFDMDANLQDCSGDYDLRFGSTFYDNSWFENYNQREILAKINCPTVLMHTKVKIEDGILLGAMTDEDARLTDSLLKDNLFIDQIDSGHGIHEEKPQLFIKVLSDFKERLGI